MSVASLSYSFSSAESERAPIAFGHVRGDDVALSRNRS